MWFIKDSPVKAIFWNLLQVLVKTSMFGRLGLEEHVILFWDPSHWQLSDGRVWWGMEKIGSREVSQISRQQWLAGSWHRKTTRRPHVVAPGG